MNARIRMADIGEPQREVTFEPLPTSEPIAEPTPAVEPSTEPELVPA